MTKNDKRAKEDIFASCAASRSASIGLYCALYTLYELNIDFNAMKKDYEAQYEAITTDVSKSLHYTPNSRGICMRKIATHSPHSGRKSSLNSLGTGLAPVPTVFERAPTGTQIPIRWEPLCRLNGSACIASRYSKEMLLVYREPTFYQLREIANPIQYIKYFSATETSSQTDLAEDIKSVPIDMVATTAIPSLGSADVLEKPSQTNMADAASGNKIAERTSNTEETKTIIESFKYNLEVCCKSRQ